MLTDVWVCLVAQNKIIRADVLASFVALAYKTRLSEHVSARPLHPLYNIQSQTNNYHARNSAVYNNTLTALIATGIYRFNTYCIQYFEIC